MAYVADDNQGNVGVVEFHEFGAVGAVSARSPQRIFDHARAVQLAPSEAGKDLIRVCELPLLQEGLGVSIAFWTVREFMQSSERWSDANVLESLRLSERHFFWRWRGYFHSSGEIVTYRILHEDERTIIRVRSDDRKILCVFVEIPDKKNRTSLAKLVERELSEHTFDRGVTAAIARALDCALNSAEGTSELPAWAMFASVSLNRDSAEVTVAGPHQVSLIVDGKIVASARQHVLADDPRPPGWSEEALSAIDVGIHGNIVTRALGKTTGNVPETTHWAAGLPFEVLICAADFAPMDAIAAFRNAAPVTSGPSAVLLRGPSSRAL